MEALRRSYLLNLARTAQVYKELEPFLDSVRRAGLRTALTKGGRLALELYPEPALRPFWDLDFIVHPSDWTSLRGVLERLGYAPAAEATDKLPLDWTFSPYFRKGLLFLEFHFTPLGLNIPSGSDGAIWSSAGRLPVRGTEAMVLPAEHELCYLCVHAQQHSYQRLIWLADIAGLASRKGLDWNWIARIAGEARIKGPVYYGLRLAEGLWPGSLPQAPLSELKPGPAETAILGWLWPERTMAGRKAAPAWPYYMPSLFSLWERKDPALAAKCLAGIIFPPRAWMAANYGLPAGSPRLYGRYMERMLRPVLTAAKKLLTER